jgi:hypothetical protein
MKLYRLLQAMMNNVKPKCFKIFMQGWYSYPRGRLWVLILMLFFQVNKGLLLRSPLGKGLDMHYNDVLETTHSMTITKCKKCVVNVTTYHWTRTLEFISHILLHFDNFVCP